MNANEILQKALVIDAHLDLPSDLAAKHSLGRTNVIIEDYLESFKEGKVDIVFGAIFVKDEYLPEQATRRALEQIAALYREVDKANGQVVIVKNTKDILKARERGQIGILMAFEGVEPLCGDVKLLRTFYEMGVRVVGLCHARSNWAADGARFHKDVPGYGVTDAGIDLIAYAEELGMLIDVSHINFKGFWDVVEHSTRPFIASHSNSYSVSPSTRNLKDDQVRVMKERGCVIGVNGVGLMVNYENRPAASLEKMIEHFLYLKKIGSISILGIGLDQYDRMTPKGGPKCYDVIPTHEKMPELVNALIEKGFLRQELFDILGDNVLRILKETIG